MIHSNTDEINEYNNINFNFYDMHQFHTLTQKIDKNSFSLMRTNIESLCAKEDRLKTMLSNANHEFDIIALSETWNSEDKNHKFCPPILEGYHSYEGITGNTLKGGCGFYIKESINYTTRPDLDYKIINKQTDFECKWIELVKSEGRGQKNNLLIGVIYRHPSKQDIEFIKYIEKILRTIKKEGKKNYNW